MKERGILFKDEMVRAILEGRKTQTRRICPVQPTLVPGDADMVALWSVFYPWGEGGHGIYETERELREEYDRLLLARCPYGKKGDRLWVRQAWRWADSTPARSILDATDPELPVLFRSDEHDPSPWKWRPGIYLKRVHARTVLDVLDVRIERLHEISEADAKAEGVVAPWDAPGRPLCSAREAFELLWGEVNGRESWEANPLVYALSFKRLEPAGD
jgi:hypothetical protein